MTSFTMKVIPRANTIALKGYKHCCHVMLHSPVEEKLFGYHPIKSAVLMQLRFDGQIGFPGGFVDGGESLEAAINREVIEELGRTSKPVNVTEDNYVISHSFEEQIPQLNITKKLCLHFFAKNVPLEQFLQLEKRNPDVSNVGYEVLGVIRCPLYIMRDKRGGLPNFLKNKFVGNSRQQLLLGLERANILTGEEITEAVQLSGLQELLTPKL